jgi:hypothetical protein
VNIDHYKSFLNRKVEVSEQLVKLSLKIGDFEMTHYEILENQAVMQELQQQIEADHLILRTWLPDSCGTCDVISNRLNVRIAKNQNNDFVIESLYLG